MDESSLLTPPVCSTLPTGALDDTLPMTVSHDSPEKQSVLLPLRNERHMSLRGSESA